MEMPLDTEDQHISAHSFPAAGHMLLHYSTSPPADSPSQLKTRWLVGDSAEQFRLSEFGRLPAILTPAGNCKNHRARLGVGDSPVLISPGH